MKVGWSAWEYKIDTKMFQDKKNNHFEDDNDNINEPNKQILQYEGQRNKFNMHVLPIIRVLRGLDGGSAVGGRRPGAARRALAYVSCPGENTFFAKRNCFTLENAGSQNGTRCTPI